MEQGHVSRAPLVAQYECTPWHAINASSFLQQQAATRQPPLRSRTQHSGAICDHPFLYLTHTKDHKQKMTWLLLRKELVRWQLSSLAAKLILGGACFKNPCVELGVGGGADYKKAQGEFGGDARNTVSDSGSQSVRVTFTAKLRKWINK